MTMEKMAVEKNKLELVLQFHLSLESYIQMTSLLTAYSYFILSSLVSLRVAVSYNAVFWQALHPPLPR
jgi:hypothetical protein